MKGIQKYNHDAGKWELISASYCGLTPDDAKKEIKKLRKWAKEDATNAKYRIVNVEIWPR